MHIIKNIHVQLLKAIYKQFYYECFWIISINNLTMQKLINLILTHPNLFHASTTITKQHLNNNYLRNHLISINCEQNLLELLQMLNNIK